MRGYVVSRLAQTVLVVFLSLTAVFAMVRLSGDPVTLFMPMDIQAKDVEEFRERLGFNDPIGVQYARFIGGAVQGDFGESLRYQRDALSLVLERLPATLLLAGTALGLTFLVAVPLGVLSAVRRNGLVDHAATLMTVLGQAVVARRVSGRRAGAHRARRQPARRLAARHARSEAAGMTEAA